MPSTSPDNTDPRKAQLDTEIEDLQKQLDECVGEFSKLYDLSSAERSYMPEKPKNPRDANDIAIFHEQLDGMLRIEYEYEHEFEHEFEPESDNGGSDTIPSLQHCCFKLAECISNLDDSRTELRQYLDESSSC